MKKLLSVFLLLMITFSFASASFFPEKANEKCITSCVREILNNTFIINNTDVSGDAYQIIDMLKLGNYGLADKLDDCQAELDKNNFNKIVVYISISIALLLIIWKTSDVIGARKKRNK